MEDPLLLYAKIQALVQNEARQVATEVYNKLGTKYDVAEVPTHTHNGTDSVGLTAQAIDQFEVLPANKGGVASIDVLGSQILNESKQASNIQVAAKFNSDYVYTDPMPIVYGQGRGTLSSTGVIGAGATSATLSAVYPYESGSRLIQFDNANTDQRLVNFTKGAAGINWSNGLSGATGSVLLFVLGSPSSFAGGQAPVGTMLMFSNPGIGEYPNNGGTLWVRLNSSPAFDKGTFTLTASLATGAVGATLTSAWRQLTGIYYLITSGGVPIAVGLVNGSTTVTLVSPATAPSTASVTITGEAWYGVTFTQIIPV